MVGLDRQSWLTGDGAFHGLGGRQPGRKILVFLHFGRACRFFSFSKLPNVFMGNAGNFQLLERSLFDRSIGMLGLAKQMQLAYCFDNGPFSGFYKWPRVSFAASSLVIIIVFPQMARSFDLGGYVFLCLDRLFQAAPHSCGKSDQ